MNTPIDYTSRYSFGHFLSEFLQKYTDSETETTHLVGHKIILVFKYVKISAGRPLRFHFIGAVRERSSKVRYCIVWRCSHLMLSSQQQTSQTDEACKAWKECYLMSNIPKRNLTSGCHLLKKLISLSGGLLDVTTNISC